MVPPVSKLVEVPKPFPPDISTEPPFPPSDDAVFVPSFTYIASAESIALVGGVPYFVDVGDDYNICPKSLETAIDDAKKNNHNPLQYLDVVALVAPLGIFFGRLANFMNSELYGIETKVPWAVKFIKIDNLYRHPSQLYEAFFEGLILFLILVYFRYKGFIKIPGFISGLFLFFYSIFRFIIEFFRIPDEQLGYLFLNLTMGQLISLIFLFIGIYLIITRYEFKKEL